MPGRRVERQVMSEGKTVLVKVGGSLFSLDDLAGRLQLLFAATKAVKVLIVPGGGKVTDFVRDWDELHSLAPEASHQLAIDTLGLTARLLASVLPGSNVVEDESMGEAFPKVSILDVPAIVAGSDCQKSPQLPVGWHVTSDSIAAWIAVRLKIDELVLAKSTAAPRVISNDSELGRASGSSSVIDSGFGSFIPWLPPLFWCDLRGDPRELFAFEKSADGSRLTVASSLD